MIISRIFKNSDAKAVANLVKQTMYITNIKDYSREYLENDLKDLTAQKFIEKAKYFHCYVLIDTANNEVVAVGSIGPYWGKKDESSLFNIFVLPEYQGKGIGRKLITVLESDIYFKRANRIEIPASITGLGFYQKMGYHFKNGNNSLDNEQLYRLEKFN
ncbi:MAG: GNAT family N-acetyltransferase [Liquorilactobacillus nagelii]|jgi:ribosomal protein S18 acetylase RimI-like enzyme|uniref:GNAT family N-acetyltransferase n=1 Tax=Liquorilactobacillus nagelii TaxID=82688 RepID=UPI002432F794|nr:GNAT family N-acetyltransferase [Liquorilactobacillus nagelii]MCI1632530.1 GNAT family N-acetyltransferase [Liquorilactobacillus nagelii]MCI1920647.1 GNAT family N-acetyltransferase [Liquorilactobacillus nagelii]MCI1976991.1 GNAT family N-acetyltransferase [Liquorilactobacillus nagelii]